jgi:hypothetical protein
MADTVLADTVDPCAVEEAAGTCRAAPEQEGHHDQTKPIPRLPFVFISRSPFQAPTRRSHPGKRGLEARITIGDRFSFVRPG